MATAEDIAARARAEGASRTTIWAKGSNRSRGRSSKRPFEFRLLAKRPWLADFNSLRLVRDMGDQAAIAIYQGIADGRDPATGASRPAPKYRSGTRMVLTGELLRSITRSKVSGKSAAKSRCVIRPKRDRRGAVNAEAGRGNFIFRLDGLVESSMGAAVDGFVLDGLGAEGLPPGPGDLSQKRAWQLLGLAKPARRRRSRIGRARPDSGGIFDV